MSLQGKVIIVTGGTKGVGRGVAESAGANGAKVVISGRCEEDGFEVCDFIRNKHKGEAIFVKGDLRKPEVCENLVNQAIAKYGKVDGLVNYAGVLPASALPNTEESEFDDVFDINVKAAFFCTKFVLRAMMENGGGSIVFIGSVHAYGGEDDRAAYSCSKGALLTMSKHIARNYGQYCIRSNWVTMGWVATPGEMALRAQQGRDLKWLEKTAADQIPLGRLLTVEDHVPGILYLLSDKSSMVTGSELQIAGGLLL